MPGRLSENTINEARKVWGSDRRSGIGGGQPRYLPENAEYWLLDWQHFCLEADVKFGWADLRIDILSAISGLPQPVIEIFELRCRRDYTEDETRAALHIGPGTYKRKWYTLVQAVREAISASDMFEHVPGKVFAIPTGRVFLGIGQFGERS